MSDSPLPEPPEPGPVRRAGRVLWWWIEPAAWTFALLFAVTAAFPDTSGYHYPRGRWEENRGLTPGPWGTAEACFGNDVGVEAPFRTGRGFQLISVGPDATVTPPLPVAMALWRPAAELIVCVRPVTDGQWGGFAPFTELEAGVYGVYHTLTPTDPPRSVPGRWTVRIALGPLALLPFCLACAAVRWGWNATRGDRTPWRRPRSALGRALRPWAACGGLTGATLLAVGGVTGLPRAGLEYPYRLGARVTPSRNTAVLRAEDPGEVWDPQALIPPGRSSLQLTLHRPADPDVSTPVVWWGWDDVAKDEPKDMLNSATDAAPAWSAGSRSGTWFLGRYDTARGRAWVAGLSLWWAAAVPAVWSLAALRRTRSLRQSASGRRVQISVSSSSGL